MQNAPIEVLLEKLLGLKILPWLIGIRDFMTDENQSQHTEADHMPLDNVSHEQEQQKDDDEMWRNAQRRWRDGQRRSQPGTSSAVLTPDQTCQEGEQKQVRSEPARSNAVANPDETIQPFFPIGLAKTSPQC